MTIKIQKEKGKISAVVLEGSFYYCNVRKPRAIYDDRKLSYEQARKEYSLEVAVSEDDADIWDQTFSKQPAKKYSNAAFIEKYKLEDESQLPFPDEKKQYTIKIVQKAQKKDGAPISNSLIPRVIAKGEDGKMQDITFEKNVGNGSKGAVKIRVNSNDYGTFAYLSLVRVDDLIEYADGGGLSKDDIDFLGGEVEFAEVPAEEAKSESPAHDKGGDDQDTPFDSDDDFGDDDDFS